MQAASLYYFYETMQQTNGVLVGIFKTCKLAQTAKDLLGNRGFILNKGVIEHEGRFYEGVKDGKLTEIIPDVRPTFTVGKYIFNQLDEDKKKVLTQYILETCSMFENTWDEIRVKEG